MKQPEETQRLTEKRKIFKTKVRIVANANTEALCPRNITNVTEARHFAFIPYTSNLIPKPILAEWLNFFHLRTHTAK